MDINRHLRGHQWELIPRREVDEAVITARQNWGFDPRMAVLFTQPDGTAKFAKGTVPIIGVSMLPHALAWPEINMCPNSTPACRKDCLVFSGRGRFDDVYAGRGWKTELLIDFPNAWFTMFHGEVAAALKKWPNVRVRPNVFSDVHWEKLLPAEFWKEFKNVKFMDYTKGWHRKDTPKNYRLVYSASERHSIEQIQERVRGDRERVTVVFDLNKKDALPKRWHGMRVVDGDVDDDLWSRPAGSIIGLRAKGSLRQADSDFKRKVA